MRGGIAAGLLSALIALAGLPAQTALAVDPISAGTPVQAPASVPPSASLGPLLNIRQTLNNCGPSSVAEVLDYWGVHKSQAEVQAVLRADGNQGGMAPFGIPSYVRGLGLSVLMAPGGTDALLKALVASGFPVIVSQWVSLGDHYGHYRPIESYDDARAVFVSSDPYMGQGYAISYNEFDQIWASSNNRFYVIYPPARETQMKAVLSASGWDATSSLMADIAIQQERLNAGFTAGPQGWPLRRGYSALTMAWDNLQLGDIAAAQRALDNARVQRSSPVVIGWIANEIALRQSQAPAAASS